MVNYQDEVVRIEQRFNIDEGISQTMLRIELLLKEQGDAYFRKTVP